MKKRIITHGEPLSFPIYWMGKQWAVTGYGVECMDFSYSFNRKMLWDTHAPPWSWEKHMAEKRGVDMPDFLEALAVARKRFKRPIKTTIG